MTKNAPVVALDADDTLWKNEEYFRDAEHRFVDLVRPTCDLDEAAIVDHLLGVERQNVDIYGYGVKGFTLSMLECAHELSGGTIEPAPLREILALGQAVLRHPVELLDGVADAIDELRATYTLLLITKGDLVHQQNKIDASGLADRFAATHIVAEKDPVSYAAVLDDHGVAATDFVMVGNSVKSDVLPVIELGGQGVHVPYHMTWAAEVVEAPTEDFPVIDSLADLAPLLESWQP